MFAQIKYILKSLLHKPFKVGMISYYYPSKKNKTNNGVAMHTFYLSRALAKFGCDIHIFARGEKKKIEEEYIGKGKITTHRIDTKFANTIQNSVIEKRIKYLIFDNKLINEISSEHSRSKFDLIHSHGWLTSGAFISKYFNNLKWIHTFHALEKNRVKFMTPEEKKYYQISKWIESTIRNANSLIAVSKKLKIEILQNYPVKEENVHVIPNGVDPTIFHPEQSVTEKIIAYVGRFSKEKGIDLLPEIISEVFSQDDEVAFEILAPDVDVPKSLEKTKNKLNELIEKYPKRIIWYKESKSREEVAEIFKKCLFCIQPSRYESFGMTVLEAMACGKPSIASNRGGLPEVVDNAGIITSPNSKSFTKKILKLLKDYRLRERYSRRALEKAKDFSWDEIAKKTLILYKVVTKKIKKGEDKYDFKKQPLNTKKADR